MKTTHENFLREQVPQLLKNLEADTKPLWGIMQAQHMLEHVSGAIYISRRDIGLKLATPESHLDRMREFLHNSAPFPKGMKNPALKPGELAKLRFPNLDAAKDKLVESIEKYYAHYEHNPEDRQMHPVFGMLNRDEWQTVHYKHVYHHFEQFGLVEPAQ